jgi:hypothetical protein
MPEFQSLESRLENLNSRNLFRASITGTLCQGSSVVFESIYPTSLILPVCPLQFPYRKLFVDIPIDRGATQGNDFIYPPISAKNSDDWPSLC